MQIFKKRVEDLEGEDFALETILDYAQHADNFSFFELLKDNAGYGRDFDDILYGYADENAREIADWIDYR